MSLPLGLRSQEDLGPVEKDCPPPGDDLLFQVMLTAELRHAPPASQQVKDNLGLELRAESAPLCHRGPSCLRTDCTPLWDLSSKRGPLHIFHLDEYSLLLGVNIRDRPPGIGTSLQVLAKYGLTEHRGTYIGISVPYVSLYVLSVHVLALVTC
jgi:hypothetical protein